jgi:hypothetical protein
MDPSDQIIDIEMNKRNLSEALVDSQRHRSKVASFGQVHDDDPKSRPIPANGGGKKEKLWNPSLVDGFARSAAFIVRDKDKASALFRRFDTTSMRNLLYLQARVASLKARQEAFDKEDFAALNQAPLNLGDRIDLDPKVRLVELERRLAEGYGKLPEGDISVQRLDTDGSNLGRRIEDLVLCLDYPLQPLNEFRGPFTWTQESSTSFQAPRSQLPRALLEVHPTDRLDLILLIVAHRQNLAPDDIEDYLGVPVHRRKEGGLEARTEAFEYFLQDSLKADLKRRIVPNQLLNFSMSWEDMEMFGNDLIFNRRKNDWDRKRDRAFNRGETSPGEWPWNDISEHWRQKMEDRYRVAMDLKQALKEYRECSINVVFSILTEILTDEALIAQRAVLQLPQPAERTKTAQEDWFTGVLGKDDMPQFIDASADIFDGDMVSIGTTGEDDYFSKKPPEWMPSVFIVS